MLKNEMADSAAPVLSEDERRAQIMAKLAEAQAARAAQQAATEKETAQKQPNKFGASSTMHCCNGL
jgi:hypothetical protein